MLSSAPCGMRSNSIHSQCGRIESTKKMNSQPSAAVKAIQDTGKQIDAVPSLKSRIITVIKESAVAHALTAMFHFILGTDERSGEVNKVAAHYCKTQSGNENVEDLVRALTDACGSKSSAKARLKILKSFYQNSPAVAYSYQTNTFLQMNLFNDHKLLDEMRNLSIKFVDKQVHKGKTLMFNGYRLKRYISSQALEMAYTYRHKIAETADIVGWSRGQLNECLRNLPKGAGKVIEFAKNPPKSTYSKVTSETSWWTGGDPGFNARRGYD